MRCFWPTRSMAETCPQARLSSSGGAGEHYGDDWVKYVARISLSATGKKG